MLHLNQNFIQQSTHCFHDENYFKLPVLIPFFFQTYGFQMDVGTAIRNADRDLLNTETPRDFELDRESLQVFTEVSLHQMPLDFSLHSGEYKHHSVLIKCLHKGW